jgi:hypothetical protein
MCQLSVIGMFIHVLKKTHPSKCFFKKKKKREKKGEKKEKKKGKKREKKRKTLGVRKNSLGVV